MRKYNHPPIETISLEQILYALSDSVRLSFVNNLAKNEKQSCGDLTIGIAKSTASHHFRVLRESGIIYMQAEGKHYINSLRKEELDKRFPGLLDAVLYGLNNN
ncbi:ArsR/SmtB family transcription factor [Poseidonibacter lekithochrous]|uniref:ArsR/SmtB family transcription factor n=1 Tax=Poseidonibacter lekithochrous TaxID=1904463 RepID=UPI0008FC60D0|nr:helix-turn-helix transcriptional regulator [Poseidonibacter lekithochrous]QKJ24217.1 transcriptional regulator, ArsR family [Poseidonibacter lekithochrous]